MTMQRENQRSGRLLSRELTIGIREVAGVTVLDLKGQLVLGEANRGFDLFINLLAVQGKGVVLNFEQLKHIDSGGLGSLVGAAVKLNGRVAAVRIGARVDSLLAICKLVTVLPTFDTELEGIQALTGTCHEGKVIRR
jgi:anti-anti-sigma factor